MKVCQTGPDRISGRFLIQKCNLHLVLLTLAGLLIMTLSLTDSNTKRETLHTTHNNKGSVIKWMIGLQSLFYLTVM